MRNNISALNRPISSFNKGGLKGIFHPKRRFGQNFLKNRNFVKKIVDFSKIENEIVVEIGAGKGALTKEIAEKAKKVFAVEIDKELVEILRSLIIPNSIIINCDFLKIDLKDFEQPVIVGNIPYSITTSILETLVKQKNYFKRAVLTVQKEYGERILAQAGESVYGALSLYVNYYFLVKKGFLIPARFFSPKPEVGSMVISLQKKEPPFFLQDEDTFFDFIRGVFRYRRKFLKNAIVYHLHKLPQGIDEALLKKRPQELTIDDYRYLYQRSQTK